MTAVPDSRLQHALNRNFDSAACAVCDPQVARILEAAILPMSNWRPAAFQTRLLRSVRSNIQVSEASPCGQITSHLIRYLDPVMVESAPCILSSLIKLRHVSPLFVAKRPGCLALEATSLPPGSHVPHFVTHPRWLRCAQACAGQMIVLQTTRKRPCLRCDELFLLLSGFAQWSHPPDGVTRRKGVPQRPSCSRDVQNRARPHSSCRYGQLAAQSFALASKRLSSLAKVQRIFDHQGTLACLHGQNNVRRSSIGRLR